MWSKFALVGVALAVGLQGCVFGDLPMAVKIAVGNQCHDAAAAVSDKEGLKDIAAGEHGCGSADEEKLKDLGVEDCTKTLHETIGFVLTTECENSGAQAIADTCTEVSSDCKDALDSTIKKWIPESLPDKDAEVEEQEGLEAMMAIMQSCGRKSESFINKESEKIEQSCKSEVEAEDLITMGVSAGDCPDYVITELTELHTVFCAAAIMLQVPEDPEDVNKKFIEDATDAYFADLPEDTPENVGQEGDGEQADRLRLFQTTIKGRKWPGRKSSLSKVAIFGGAALIALTALAAVGVRRHYKRQPEAEEQDLLESAE